MTLTPAQKRVLADVVAAPADWVEITGYREAQEVLRSAKMSVKTSSPNDLRVRGRAVSRLDGPEHSLRRKTLNRLVRRDGHVWFRESVLYPTIARTLDRIFAGTEIGNAAHVDLVAFSDRVNTQLAAAIVGFDRVDTEEGLAEFRPLDDATDFIGRLVQFEILYQDVDQAAVERSFEAWDEIARRFYEPSLARRRELLRRVEAGDLAETELPHDLLTLIAAHLDPAMSEPGVGMQEAMTSFRAASKAPAQQLAHAVRHLTEWLADHSEDFPRRTDTAFLLAALNESMRLGTGTAKLMRRALEDVVLESSGRRIKAGQYVMLRTAAANRDPLFGPDAGEFNPNRDVPAGEYAYGLTFGAGSHMCYGMPLVLGNEGLDGSLVYILRRLFELGVRPDPDALPQRWEHARTDMPRYGTYPVLLGGQRSDPS